MRALVIGLAAAAAFTGVLGGAFGGPALAAETSVAQAPADYSKPEAWLCLPGRKDACSVELDAIAITAQGERTPKPFKAAADPKVDCFYVYPTVSQEPTTYADMTPGAGETRAAESQAARFAAKCRVFAPVYRSITLAGLGGALHDNVKIDWDVPYADVRAAWRAYLAQHNHGRGVVLIGHSQGSVHLARLLAEEIEGKPAQKLLVAAYLAGVPNFSVAQGRDVGGTLKSIPLCHSAEQFGCVIAWSTYADGDEQQPRFFARDPGNGRVAVCVNPAALGGGRRPLDGFGHKPALAPAGDPPWVEMAGQFSGECVFDGAGSVLVARVEPGPLAGFLQSYVDHAQVAPGWGLHILDVALVQGNLLDLVESQGQAWAAKTH